MSDTLVLAGLVALFGVTVRARAACGDDARASRQISVSRAWVTESVLEGAALLQLKVPSTKRLDWLGVQQPVELLSINREVSFSQTVGRQTRWERLQMREGLRVFNHGDVPEFAATADGGHSSKDTLNYVVPPLWHRPFPSTAILLARFFRSSPGLVMHARGSQHWLVASMTAACIGALTCVAVVWPQKVSEEARRSPVVTVFALFVSVLLTDVIDAMHMTYFPDAALAWGMTESMVGLVIVAGYLPTICCGVFAGKVCQMFAWRSLIAVGLAMAAISNSLFTCVLLPTQPDARLYFVLSIAARLVWGIGNMIITISSMAAAGEACKANLSWGVGVMNVANAIAYTVGPMVGAALYSWAGFEGVCVIGAAVIAASLWPICRVLPLSIDSVEEVDLQIGVNMDAIHSGVLPTLLIVMLVGFGFAAIYTTAELELAKLDAGSTRNNVASTGFVLCILSLCNASSSIFVGYLAGPAYLGACVVIGVAPWLLALSAVMACVSSALELPYDLHVAFIAGAFGLWGLGSALAIVPSVDVMAAKMSARGASTSVALMLTMLNLGMIVGSSLGALGAERFGFPALFGFVAVMAVMAGLQWLCLEHCLPTSPASGGDNTPFLVFQSSPCLLPSPKESTPREPPSMISPLLLPSCEAPTSQDAPSPTSFLLPCAPVSVPQSLSTHQWPANVVLVNLFLSIFLSSSIDAMPMVYLPDAATKWGMTPSMIGIVIAAGYLPVAFLGGLAVSIDNWLGHRLSIVGGLVLGGMANALLVVVPLIARQNTHVILVVFASLRLVYGTSTVMVSISCAAVAGELFKSDRSWALGVINVGNEIAYSLGPIIGAALYTAVSFSGVCLLGAGALLVGVLPICLLVPEAEVANTPASIATMTSFPPVVATVIAVLLVGFGFAAIDTTVELELAHVDTAAMHNNVLCAGFVLCAKSLANAVVSPHVGTLAAPARIGARTIIGFAPWLLLISAAFASLSTSLPMPYVLHVVLLTFAFGLWGIGAAMVIVPAPEFMAVAAGVPERLDISQALMTASLSVGTITGSSLGALCMEYFDFSRLFAFIAIASACTGLQWYAFTRDCSEAWAADLDEDTALGRIYR